MPGSPSPGPVRRERRSPRRSRVAVLLLVTALGAAACAAKQAPGLSERFVVRGDAPATPINTPGTSSAVKIPAADENGVPIPREPVAKMSGGPTLESEDVGLKAALVALQTAPTGPAHRRVGEVYR